MNTNPPASTYEGQLAARVADVLPDTDTAERLELLGVMDPDDMRSSLAWLISHAPRMFDFALVRDLAMTERLMARLNEGQADDEEPYCQTCGAAVGVFHGHGDAWLHYTGEGTAASPVELFDPGHAPVIAWRPASVSGESGRDGSGEDSEACPECGAVDWGQTPDGRAECTRCLWREPKVTS